MGEAGHVVGVLYEAVDLRGDLRGELRREFAGGTTDDARWFPVEEIRGLPRVELVDFVLDLIT